MPLSENFDLNEFDQDAAIPDACLPVLTDLCQQILEHVREFCGGKPLVVTSGYRDAVANAAAHGQPNSEHIYTPAWCAADFAPPAGVPARTVFDWMRNNPYLPYHQLILEHGKVSTVIHVSMNKLHPGLRSVLEGATHNAEPYTKVDYVAYQPPSAQPLSADQSTQV